MKFITLENLSQFWSNIKREIDNIKASMGNKADRTELPKDLGDLTNNAGYLKSVTNISGNAGTATKLQKAVNINGVAFDGSKSITVADSTKVAPSGSSFTANRIATFADTTGKAIKDSGFTIGASLPSDAKFTDTNTWRGVQDNLTSTLTDQSLSANQGKVLKGLIDGKANSNHTHDDRYYTENEIDNKLGGKVPTSSNSSITVQADADSSSTSEYISLRAGGNELKIISSAGGSSPAKTNNVFYNGNALYHTGHKPSKGDVGLGNVDNTSDADKPVSTAQQAALDLKQDKTDNTLATTSKTVVGAINEVKGVADAAAKADASNITVATWKTKLGFITADGAVTGNDKEGEARSCSIEVNEKDKDLILFA